MTLRADEAVTLGVEEEFQLLSPAGTLVSAAPAVLAAAAVRSGGELPEQVQGELPLSQVEIATPVCGDLAAVRRQLTRLRRLVVASASDAGCSLAAVSTPPLAVLGDQSVDASEERYASMQREYGYLVREQLIAGLHVHVGVPDRDRAVGALDRVRPWLPVVLALSAGSPFWLGADSGFASYRAVHWGRWPVSGDPPLFGGSAAAYDGVLRALLAGGVLRDHGQVYWSARLSARYPTIEWRVCDTPLTVEDSVALAGLLRGLTRTALAELDAGVPAAAPTAELQRLAHWRAARHGVEDHLLDLRSGRLVPAAELVGSMLDHVRLALLETGDLEVVSGHVARVLRGGGGAARQRAAAAEGGLGAVVAMVVAATRSGLGLGDPDGAAP